MPVLGFCWIAHSSGHFISMCVSWAWLSKFSHAVLIVLRQHLDAESPRGFEVFDLRLADVKELDPVCHAADRAPTDHDQALEDVVKRCDDVLGVAITSLLLHYHGEW